LILIPTFNWIIYPAFEKCNLLKKPLQRMTVGMLLACVAFMISALLEYKIQNEFMNKNSSPNSIQLVNLTPLDIKVNTSNFSEIIEPTNQLKYLNSGSNINQTFTFTYKNNLSTTYDNFESSNDKYLKNNYLIYFNKDEELKTIQLLSSIQKEPIGKSQLRIFYLNSNNDNANSYEVKIENFAKTFSKIISIENLREENISLIINNYQEINFDEYTIFINQKMSNISFVKTLRLENGARSTFIIFLNKINSFDLIQIEDIFKNQINFGYQFFQYFLISVAEIMFSISGLAFAYSQAPESMKSVLQAVWILTFGIGDLIVIIVAESNFIKNQVNEYLLFSFLILISTLIFGFMSYFYVYIEPRIMITEHEKKTEDSDNESYINIKRKNSQSSEVQLVNLTDV
jgi:hypothetical protein